MDELIKLDNVELRNKLKNSMNQEELSEIINIFNVNLQKKEIIRADIFSDLQNKIVDQISKRIDSNSDTFSNKDLLDYLNSIQNILNNQKNMSNVNTPTIAIQQNIMVGNQDELTKESRDKIKDVIQNILKNQTIQNDNIIEEPNN